MSLEAYEDLGGVRGALSAYAEQAWKDNVRPADESTARQLFTQLIRVPLGSGGATRRTVLRTELGEEEWRIAQQLATTRLLVTGRSAEGMETVELAHEALHRDEDPLLRVAAASRHRADHRMHVLGDPTRVDHAHHPLWRPPP